MLRDVTFSVEAGSALAVIGPNGAGKTVLFRALVGAIPYSGAVRWAPGTRLGYVPQKLDLERDVPITGLDFLGARAALERRAASRRAPGGPEGPPCSAAIAEALGWVGLSNETCRTPIGELSGGQFQRLLIAFALIGDPTMLLLDEPTAGVDEPGQERLNELVRRLQVERGLTVIFISHELTVVAKYATRVLCLSRTGASFGAPVDVLSGDVLQQLYGSPVALHLHEH